MNNYSITIQFSAVTNVTDTMFDALCEQSYEIEQVCSDIADMSVGVACGDVGEVEFFMSVLDVEDEEAALTRAKEVVGLIIAATGGAAPGDFAVAKHADVDQWVAA